jgi:hypothetical protein
MPDQTSDNYDDVGCDRMKTSRIVSLPVVLFRRRVAMIISRAALFARNTVPVGS